MSKLLMGLLFVALAIVLYTGCSDDGGSTNGLPISPSSSATNGISSSNGSDGDKFGSSVSFSDDGQTLVSGSPFFDESAKADMGAAYIYRRHQETDQIWYETLIIPSSGAAGDHFGVSVSMSGDGNTIVVGSPLYDGGTSNAGAAYVYKRSGEGWLVWDETKLVAPDRAASDEFGTSVAISGDGATIVVGCPMDNTGLVGNHGSIYIFQYIGTAWVSTKILASDKGAGDTFGSCVAVSSDGGIVAVGSPLDNTGLTSNHGSIYIFRKAGAVWEQTKITASDRAGGDKFGSTIAISGNGDLVAVGSPYDHIGSIADQGSVYMYKYVAGTWTGQKITAVDGSANDRFGSSVALSDDGNALSAGVPFDDNTASDSGSVYIFLNSNDQWKLEKKAAPYWRQAGDNFGASVAMTSQGDRVAIGCPSAAINPVHAGDPYLGQGTVAQYTYNDNNWLENDESDEFRTILSSSGSSFLGKQVSITPDGSTIAAISDNNVYVYQWNGISWQEAALNCPDSIKSISISDDGQTIAAGAPYNYYDQGAVYIYHKTAGVWDSGTVITATNRHDDEKFGSSVAISGDGNTVLVGVPDYYFDEGPIAGMAYGYSKSGSTWVEHKLPPIGGDSADYFGFSVALSYDGTTAVIGTNVSYAEGYVCVYRNWTGSRISYPSLERFGYSVSVSSDGNTLSVGNIDDGGDAYIYSWSGSAWTQDVNLVPGSSSDYFGMSMSLSPEASFLAVADPYGQVGYDSDHGQVFVYSKNGEDWTETLIDADDKGGQIEFGAGIAISSNCKIMAVGVPRYNSYAGSIFVYRGGYAELDTVSIPWSE